VEFYPLAFFVKWRSPEACRSVTDIWVSGSIPLALGVFHLAEISNGCTEIRMQLLLMSPMEFISMA
jgi:hypothetical protein